MIELKNISVSFAQKKQVVDAVKNVSISVDKGDIYGIVGYSGAGKSTLVRTINFLQKPTNGEVFVNGTQLARLSKREIREKRKKIGMIFQHFNLMESRTIFENVAFPLKYSGISKKERDQRVTELLALVGLAEKAKNYPKQLSGGQKQRVAIARALATQPEILLCDEATSALDPKTTQQILDLLKTLNQQLNLTIVLITHEMQVVKSICNKVAVMENGELIESGESVQIFSQPKETLTQDFIRTATHIDSALSTILEDLKLNPLHEGDQLLELNYVGENTNEALLTQLYACFKVEASILYGNVEFLQETPIGSLIVRLRGEESKIVLAKDFLIDQGVFVKDIPKTSSYDIGGEHE